LKQLPHFEIRPIVASDVAALASIHAASWRNAYRGILGDAFLDGDLVSNRMALWHKRLASPSSQNFGFLAIEEGQPVGFTFAFGAHDARWGTQIDNLHVIPQRRGTGIGARLLESLYGRSHDSYPHAGLYLWAYEANVAARRYYENLGAAPIERVVINAPDGSELAEWRYVWASAAAALASLQRRKSFER